MARLRRFFNSIYTLRSHPNRVVRLIWWISVLGLLSIVLSSASLRGISLAILSIYAMAISTLASLWGVTHPRVVLQVRNLALRWSLLLSVVGTLCLVSIAGAEFSEATNLAFPTGAIFLFSLLVVLPLFFIFALPVSLYGAAMGVWDSRKDLSSSFGAAHRGVNAIWWTIASLFLLGQVLENFRPPSEINVGLFFLIPLVARYWSRYPTQEYLRLKFMVLLGGMEHRLVYQTKRANGTIRTLDLRGAALGAFASGVVLFIAWLGIWLGYVRRSLPPSFSYATPPLAICSTQIRISR